MNRLSLMINDNELCPIQQIFVARAIYWALISDKKESSLIIKIRPNVQSKRSHVQCM